MATITSAQSGSPIVGATWVGGVAPGIGDDFVIASGHTITLSLGDTWTVGNDGAAGTLAGKVQSGGTFICNGQANFRGDFVHHRGGTVTGGPGGKIVLDSGTAGVYYKWIGNDTGSGLATFNTTSDASNVFVVSGDGGRGGDKGYVNWGESFAYLYHTMSLHHVRFEDLGTSSRKGFFGMAWASGSSISTVNACWLRCGDTRIYRGTNGALDLQSISIRNPLNLINDGRVLDIGEQVVNTNAKTIGSITVYTPTASKSLAYIKLSNVTYTRAVICGVFLYAVGTNITIDELFLLNSQVWADPMSNFVCNNAICCSHVRNPHYFHEISGTGKGLGASHVSNVVFDSDGYFESDTGDCFLPINEYIAENVIAINEAGVIVTPQGSNTARMTLKNVTSCKSYGAVSGEATAQSNAYVKIIDSIFYKQSEGIHQLEGHAPLVDTTVIDYNCCYNMASGYTLYDYNLGGVRTNLMHPTGGFLSYVGAEHKDDWMVTKSYGDSGFGANDISVDPQFVDDTVTVRGWGAWSTHDDMMRELVTIDGLAYDGSATTATTKTASQCWDYISSGFTPQNMALANAGSDGGFIGAVQPINPDTTAPVLTSPSATATSATTATASVSTDDGNGTLYFLASTNATETAATVKAALSQAVTASGEQTVSLEGLDPETTYYVHFVQVNGASLESEDVVSTAAFTTPEYVDYGDPVAFDGEFSDVTLAQLGNAAVILRVWRVS